MKVIRGYKELFEQSPIMEIISNKDNKPRLIIGGWSSMGNKKILSIFIPQKIKESIKTGEYIDIDQFENENPEKILDIIFYHPEQIQTWIDQLIHLKNKFYETETK